MPIGAQEYGPPARPVEWLEWSDSEEDVSRCIWANLGGPKSHPGLRARAAADSMGSAFSPGSRGPVHGPVLGTLVLFILFFTYRCARIPARALPDRGGRAGWLLHSSTDCIFEAFRSYTKGGLDSARLQLIRYFLKNSPGRVRAGTGTGARCLRASSHGSGVCDILFWILYPDTSTSDRSTVLNI